MSNKKIIVTGGAGFIGSHLCERLSEDKNNDVYSIDNYFTGSEENHVKNVTYIRGDTREIDDLIKFKPERRGNRMVADVITSRTESLGWSSKGCIKSYIEKSRRKEWV